MHFNTHWQVEGKHAFLGASKYHWVNYDLAKMERIFENTFAAQRGTELHNLAKELIRLNIKLPRNNQTLNAYVNDAIGFRMTPEQVLLYSENCFGTADAISFTKGILRIHDLKTGVHAGSPLQCDIYAALFCLEYKINPFDIEMLLRIYQNDEIFEHVGDPEWITMIMEKIKMFDDRIEQMRAVMV